MTDDSSASSADTRAAMKRWLENWRRVGPILEAERWERLAAMTDEDLQQVSRDLLDLWQPGWVGDGGEELLRHQRVFARRTRSRR